jgi:hypothetical protein
MTTSLPDLITWYIICVLGTIIALSIMLVGITNELQEIQDQIDSIYVSLNASHPVGQ